MALVNRKSLIQPFFPGSPAGWKHNGDGPAKRVSDERWRLAFPNCKFNKLLDDAKDDDAKDKEEVASSGNG